MSKARVGIIMGSRSDLSVMQEAADMLDEFGISHFRGLRTPNTRSHDGLCR